MKAQAPIEFPVYVLTALLENGLHWTEGLYFPEVARLGRSTSTEALLGSLRKRLERMEPLQMTQRQRPPKIKLKRFRVSVSPPKKHPGAWKEPYQLEVEAVIYRLSLGGKQLWAAHLPQFQLELTVEKPTELKEAVAREVRSLLVRNKLLGQPGDLIFMQRWQSMSGRFERVSVKAVDPAKDATEEKQLTKLTSRLAQDGPTRAVLVEEELAQLADLLADHNVLLVGPSGCGKSALIHELARRRDDFQLAATSFFETSGARLMLGEVSFGGWQKRCQKLIEELAKVKGILHLGNLQELLESARHSTNPYGLAGFLRPYLGGKKLQGLAEATPEQLAVVEREYPQLLETFTIMRLEPAGQRTLGVLNRLFPEQAPQCLQAVAELHERFTSSSASPGWPVRFVRGLLRQQRRPERAEVMQHFSRQSGLPLLFLEDSQPFVRAQVRDWFSQRLQGQELAVDRAVDRLAAFKHGLTRPNRPVASFLLIGPTGVGKTELARCLAEFVFQDRDRLTRLDMSEYSTAWAVKRLIGGESGLLVAKVRERPFQVLLFDEVEKAHPDFFDLLLQVLGDARLSDERGEVADFSNCLILMTSNLGADSFHKGSLGLREQTNEGQFMQAVRAAFRPELLNRIDEIIPFQVLSKESVLRICQWELQRLGLRQGLRGRSLELKIGPGVDELLAQQGYHRLYGARPLKRALDRLLLAPLSQQINAHPAQVALKVHIDVSQSGPELLVRSYPQSTVDKANAQQEKQRECNHAVSQLRRRYRRLEKGPVVTELRNEKVRHEQKFKTAWPHTHFLEGLDGLGPRVNELEEGALGALSDPHLFDVLPSRVAALAEEVVAALRQAYCLVQPQPHQILVALYSESHSSLEYLTRHYLETLEGRGYSLKLEALSLRKGNPPNLKGVLPERLSDEHERRPFTLTEQGWTWHPQLERHLLEASALGRHKALGYLLEVSGKFCSPWLRGEGGMHKLQHKGREELVLMEISSDPRVSGDSNNPYLPPAYQPPDELHRKGSLQHPVVVRQWNLDDEVCHDPVAGRLYFHDGLLDRLLEKRLLKRAAEAALLP